MIQGATSAPTSDEIKRRGLDTDVEGVAVLRDLSETTAGRFYLRNTVDPGDTFKKVAAELRQQYRLGFYAKNSVDNVRHEIVLIERMRMFFDDKRFYLVLAVLPEGEIDSVATNSYMYSFVLNNPENN